MKVKSSILLVLITSLTLMAVVFYNGFPLTEGDTGAYIEQAIYPHFAPDRTPFYGMFIRITSLWSSLWFTIFAQSLLLAYLVVGFIRYFLAIDDAGTTTDTSWKRELQELPVYLLSVVTIVTFTAVSWVTAYLMPDVFAGILLLGILLFIAERYATKLQLCIYAAIIFVAILMHNSHFVITVIFSGVLLVWAWVKNQKVLATKCIALMVICGMVWGIMCSMNAVKKHGFTFSRGKDQFMMAKLAETGILNVYLDENCGKKSLKICDYKEHIPYSLNEFLWSGESPLYKLGGWDSNRAEYSFIIHDVFTTPRYFNMFVQKSVIGAVKELVQVQAPDKILVQTGPGSEPWKKIRQYFADEYREYVTSMQNNGALSTAACNFVYYLFLLLSSLWLLFFYPKVMSRDVLFMYRCIFLFFVVNAFVTATFSTVIYRFQYRIFWVFPALNALVIIKYYYRQFITAKNNTEATAAQL